MSLLDFFIVGLAVSSISISFSSPKSKYEKPTSSFNSGLFILAVLSLPLLLIGEGFLILEAITIIKKYIM